MPSNGLHYQGDSKKKTSDILKYNCFAVFEETIRFQSLLAQKLKNLQEHFACVLFST